MFSRLLVNSARVVGKDGPSVRARFLHSPRPGGPLHGLEIQFHHHAYDWNHTAPLARLLTDLATPGAIVAASSEGGLFEYGADDAIIANLAGNRASSRDDRARGRLRTS
jgi:hypothetical protein